jgi:putative MATE family efflux protein
VAETARKPSKFDRTIVEGPIGKAVWKLAWPTMLQNVVSGLQGIIDHAMVGNIVGFVGNAAIGVSWQIVIVVVVFIASLFTGMGVLVARFAGANEPDKVNRVVYQAFITATTLGVALGILGYVAAPALLDIVRAEPEVQQQALPYLRTMFVGVLGMMFFFMLSGAFRAAGDPRTPLKLGITMTVLNIAFNVVLIPVFGTFGAALGTVFASFLAAGLGVWQLTRPSSVIHFRPGMAKRPDFDIIRSLFRFGLPTGIQGIAMNVAGVILLRFIGSLADSAEAQAVYTVGYTQLFSLITWTSVGLMGAAATVAGQNLGAGHPQRSIEGVWKASRLGLVVAAAVGLMFLLIPQYLFAVFGMTEPTAVALGRPLLGYLTVSGLFVTVALSFTGGLQGTGDTKSPLYISLVSQIVVPIGMLMVLQSLRPLEAHDIWLAIVLGHVTRATLSVTRFRQGKWRHIAVDIGASRA